MISADLNWLSRVLNAPYSDTNHTLSSEIDTSLSIKNITTDSRTIANGEVFVALKGPNFNAHKFIAEVKQKGAIAAVVDTLDMTVDIPQIVVPNTLTALGQLGAAVAAEVNAKTIAITGSVGKTSVKEMCAQILALKGKVLATAGNFNNEIGVPLTLLRLTPEHEFAVVELGANHLGEIAKTTRFARPNAAILNNVAEAHLEGFGSLQGVATAKSEIFEGLKIDGAAIFNHNSDYRAQWLAKLTSQFTVTPGRIVEFSIMDSEDVDVIDPDMFVATNVVQDKVGCASFVLNFAGQRFPVTLQVPGKHNVANALAAACACYQVGADFDQICRGLSASSSVKGRVDLHPISERLVIIDDTYNANVQSVKAAVDLLQSYDAKRILILGDMAELGSDAKKLHQDVGVYGVTHGIDHMLSFGVLSQMSSAEFEERGAHYASQSQLIEDTLTKIEHLLRSESQSIVVLVKGSRSAKMELVVEQLIAQVNPKIVTNDNTINRNNTRKNEGNEPC